MKRDLVHNLHDEIKKDSSVRHVIEIIIDRIDRNGTMPKTMVLRADNIEVRDAAVRLFSTSVAKLDRTDPMVLRLDLSKADTQLRADGNPSLCDVLYRAIGRKPQNLRRDAVERGQNAAQIATNLVTSYEGAARAFLLDTRTKLVGLRGPFYELAKQNLDLMKIELELTARCISLAETNKTPIRLANFARRATGSSKGLRTGTSRYMTVTDALLRYVPDLAVKVEQEPIGNPNDRRRIALEELGIFRNETPIDVLCFGPLILMVDKVKLDNVTIHCQLGQPAKLLLPHLRGASVTSLAVNRIVSIENETTFNDYVDWIQFHQQQEFVICTGGQANWATVQLLRIIRKEYPNLPIFHWGDLDRFGVLILRSLIRRTNIPIEPLWMDGAIYSKYLDEGLHLSSIEIQEIERLIEKTPGAPSEDLLHELVHHQRWIEQETVAEGELKNHNI